MTRMALTFDRSNRHALFNLATIEVQTAPLDAVRTDPAVYSDARAHFDEVVRMTRRSKQQGDRLHILADYQRGAVEQYQHLLSRGERGDLERAVRRLRRAETHAVGAFGEADVVTKMFTIARCAAQVLMAGPSEESWAPIPAIERRYFAPRLLYTLACYYCALAVGQGFAVTADDTSPADDPLDRALRHLRDALQTDPAYADWARNDPSLDPLRSSREETFAELVGG